MGRKLFQFVIDQEQAQEAAAFLIDSSTTRSKEEAKELAARKQSGAERKHRMWIDGQYAAIRAPS